MYLLFLFGLLNPGSAKRGNSYAPHMLMLYVKELTVSLQGCHSVV
jgi:hypothetical protein